LELTIRLYRPADFETLYRIDQSCYEPGIAYSRRMLRDSLRTDGARCYVACFGAEIAGFLIAIQEGVQGHLVTIDVVDTARRRGVGSALLARAEEELAESGARRVTLETATNNAAGIAFWQKHGYRAVGIYPRYYNDRLDAYLMTKRLRTVGGERR
jgi:ribosomal-protein-alanine N-acetyltransferase